MSGTYVATTTEDDVQWLTAAGQSVGLSVAPIRHHLAQTLGPAHGALLAEPVADTGSRTTDWYVDGAGDALPLAQLPPAAQARVTNATFGLLSDIGREAARLAGSADADERVLGAMLDRVSHVPDLDCLRVRGDRPVLVAWGHGRAGQSVDLRQTLQPAPEAAAPRTPPGPRLPRWQQPRASALGVGAAFLLSAVLTLAATAVLAPSALRGWLAGEDLAGLQRSVTEARAALRQRVASCLPPQAAPLPQRAERAPAGVLVQSEPAQIAPPQITPTQSVPVPIVPGQSVQTQGVPAQPRPSETGSTTAVTTTVPAALPPETPDAPAPPAPTSTASLPAAPDAPAVATATTQTAAPTTPDRPAAAPPVNPASASAADRAAPEASPAADAAMATAEAPPPPGPDATPPPGPGAAPPPAGIAAPASASQTASSQSATAQSASPQAAAALLPLHEAERHRSERPFTEVAVRRHDLGMLQGCWTLNGAFATVAKPGEQQGKTPVAVRSWRTCFPSAAPGAASLGGSQSLSWADGKSCAGAVTARFGDNNTVEIADASDCLGDRTLFRITQQCTRKDDAMLTCSWSANDRGLGRVRGDGLAMTP